MEVHDDVRYPWIEKVMGYEGPKELTLDLQDLHRAAFDRALFLPVCIHQDQTDEDKRKAKRNKVVRMKRMVREGGKAIKVKTKRVEKKAPVVLEMTTLDFGDLFLMDLLQGFVSSLTGLFQL